MTAVKSVINQITIVRMWPEMKEAQRAAWSIAGVTKVENQLILQVD